MNRQSSAAPAPTSTRARWLQLALGLICMMSISSPQYVCTLFTKPLAAKLGAGHRALEIMCNALRARGHECHCT